MRSWSGEPVPKVPNQSVPGLCSHVPLALRHEVRQRIKRLREKEQSGDRLLKEPVHQVHEAGWQHQCPGHQGLQSLQVPARHILKNEHQKVNSRPRRRGPRPKGVWIWNFQKLRPIQWNPLVSQTWRFRQFDEPKSNIFQWLRQGLRLFFHR